jgi:hypothetical protein
MLAIAVATALHGQTATRHQQRTLLTCTNVPSETIIDVLSPGHSLAWVRCGQQGRRQAQRALPLCSCSSTMARLQQQSRWCMKLCICCEMCNIVYVHNMKRCKRSWPGEVLSWCRQMLSACPAADSASELTNLVYTCQARARS